MTETLARARQISRSLGIVRVTEITHLDRLGIPVFVSIRPEAPLLCVCAGKGLTAAEAEAGAYMEAIEIAWSEPGRSSLAIEPGSAKAVLETREDPTSFLTLAPLWGQGIDLDGPLLCTPMTDLATGEPTLIPSELIFFPLPPKRGGLRYFGSTTNGLASGNSVLDATLHALTEVIERDVTSFHNVRDRGVRVSLETLPPPLATTAARIEEAGFTLILRYLVNPFGLPVFNALVFDRSQPWVTLRGDGCHPRRSIAATRAISETIQCRLSLIHGGRDDLTNVHRAFPGVQVEEKERLYDALREQLLGGPTIDYRKIPEIELETDDIEGYLAALTEILARAGFRRVLRAVYTPADYPVQVVRIVVPGLECYSRDSRRVGPRLRAILRRGRQVS